jgi:hypothetical protein
MVSGDVKETGQGNRQDIDELCTVNWRDDVGESGVVL